MAPYFLSVLTRRAIAVRERHGLFLVVALAVSAKDVIRLDV